MEPSDGSDDKVPDDRGDQHPSLSNLAERIGGENEPRRSGSPVEAPADCGEHSDAGETDPDHTSDEASDGFTFAAVERRVDELSDRLSDLHNLLMVGPADSPFEVDLCSSLREPTGADAVKLLVVTVDQSPDERLECLRRSQQPLPNEVAILDVGDVTRSGSSSTMTINDGGEITIQSIADPTDLQRMGIMISQQLERMMDSNGELIVCFHSLTPLLRHVQDEQKVFRFLHILHGRVKAIGARAHYHLDIEFPREELVGTLRPLFDGVVSYTEDGSVDLER